MKGTLWSLHIGVKTPTFLIVSVIGVKIRSRHVAVVSVYLVGDVTSCLRQLKDITFKRCLEGFERKLLLRSPSTIYLFPVLAALRIDWSIRSQ